MSFVCVCFLSSVKLRTKILDYVNLEIEDVDFFCHV